MLRVDPNQVASLLRRVAETIILPRFRCLGEGEVREKKPGDLVTLADLEAEAELSLHLPPLLPGSLVVGEEGVAADHAVLQRLSGDSPVWLIDPIDGTRNFVHGSPRFAVMVALVWRGETIQGWIYDPLQGRLAIAEQGSGCWIQGRKVTIAPDRPLNRQVGSVGWRPPAALGEAVGKLVRNSCAGHDYLELLEDTMQFAYFRQLHPWDHAAGELLFREAGGTSALIDGSPYRPVPVSGALLLASGPDSWEHLQRLVAGQ
jgi:fructose-1,6-bisphosphatase/inositol monophosphatase family enzyme